MKSHVQIVAILHIAMGILSLVGAIVIFLFIGVIGGIVASQGEHGMGGVIGLLAVALGGLLAILAVPGVLGGWALLTGRSWGRMLVMVLGALHIANFPFGTALGIYTFWALLQEPPTPAATPAPIQPFA